MKVKRKKRLVHCLSPDSFGYNEQSELCSVSSGAVPYDYDNIGNRKTAQAITEEISYNTNNINQYSSITRNETPFAPEFDLAGNQTKLQTSSGIWNPAYDANNHPLSFTSEDGQTVISCDYDYMGRRFMKKITIGESITVHQRYLYRGYLQIAALDMLRTQALLHRIHWDPTEPNATRPLSIRKNETWYSYGQDLTKNVTELYKADGTIASTYDYTPYGAVTATGIDQPLQWSSEVYDTELGMVYYNYRHYNPRDGRWINRDPIAEQGGWNLYLFIKNNSLFWFDHLGNGAQPIGGPSWGDGYIRGGLPLPPYNPPPKAPRNLSPKDSSYYMPGASPGTALHPSAYASVNPCRNCPKDALRTRLPKPNSNCCEYRTKKQKASHKPQSNGCGPEMLPIVDSFHFAGMPVSFLSACNAHDICYDTCGSNKRSCDTLFWMRMMYACYKGTISANETPNRIQFVLCLSMASGYFSAVALLGDIPYNDAQDNACEWEPCN